jgi:hypothetical protein
MDSVCKDLELISKPTLIHWIDKAQKSLQNAADKTENYYNVHDLRAIIDESNCCIDNCSDLERLYRWFYRILGRSMQWLDIDVYHQASDIWMCRIDKARQTMEFYVIEELKGNNMNHILSNLGFSRKF